MFNKVMIILVMIASSVVWSEESVPQSTEAYTMASGWKFGLGLGFGLGSRLRFTEAKLSSSPVKFEADLDFKNSLNFIAEARNLQPSSWGFIGTLTHETTRELDSYKLSANGTTINYNVSGEPSKIQVTLLSLNAAYRWYEFYLPFGLNFSRVKWTEPSSSVVTSVDAKGGVGIEFGAGYFLQKEIVVEALIRAVAVDLKISDSTDTINFGKGFLSTLAISGKYLF